ncbi:Uncharacterized protein TCM_012834 [Theobroma cacao]|uniref:Uncharacterized protein n=1 Tax=Theobroma cacao TaxID=3641 RepID=A0A061G2S8_THECC|nr:Uncharacterized protein TCM_012834 [Theobroma cacao]
MDSGMFFASVNVRPDAVTGVSAFDVNVNVGVGTSKGKIEEVSSSDLNATTSSIGRGRVKGKGRGRGKGKGPSVPIDVDASDDNSASSKDIKEGKQNSSDFDREGITINRSLRGILECPDGNRKVVLAENMVFTSVHHFREVMVDYMV